MSLGSGELESRTAGLERVTDFSECPFPLWEDGINATLDSIGSLWGPIKPTLGKYTLPSNGNRSVNIPFLTSLS